MLVSVAAGRAGLDTQWYLPGTDISSLPWRPARWDDAIAPDALEETVEVTDGGGGGLLDGLVTYTGASDAGPGLFLDAQDAWNSVKNASVRSEEAGRVAVTGFVHTDVSLGDGADSSVLLRGAKRGNVLTGDGGDTVTVEVAATSGWVNEFRMVTRDGDDVVVIRPLDISIAAESDQTFGSTASGAGEFTGVDEYTSVFAELGAGNDTFVALGGTEDRVWGGAGNDVIRAGRSGDWLEGGAGDDLFLFASGDGGGTIADFQPGTDRLSFDWEGSAASILDAAVEGIDGTTLSYGTDSVTLLGVSKSQLSAGDFL